MKVSQNLSDKKARDLLQQREQVFSTEHNYFEIDEACFACEKSNILTVNSQNANIQSISSVETVTSIHYNLDVIVPVAFKRLQRYFIPCFML